MGYILPAGVYKKFFLKLVIGVVVVTSINANAQTLSWSSAGLFDGESVDGATVNASSGPIVMTVAVNNSISGGGVNLDAFSSPGEGPASYEDDGSLGGISNYVQFGFDNSSCDTNDQFDVVMSFSAAINNVQLSITDIDQDSWDDIIEIYLDVDGDGVAGPQNIKTFLTNSATGAPLLTLGPNVQEADESFANGYEGITPVLSSSTTGNLDLDTTGSGLAINSITVRYFSGDDSSTCQSNGNPGSQVVGISNLEFSGTTVPVTLSYFSSTRNAGGLDIEWQTAQEVGHAGFQVYAKTNLGWELITPDLITESEASASLASKQYMLSIPIETNESDIKWLSLVDVSVNEEVVPHGPFKIGREYGGQIVEAATFEWPEQKKSKGLNSAQASKVSERIKRALRNDDQQQAVGR